MSEYPEKPVLIIDDETFILQSLSAVLRTAGINNIITCSDSREVLKIISNNRPSLILLDLTMPYISGDVLLPEIKSLYPDLSVLIITGVNELSTAVECMKNGAADYLVKAIENSKLLSAVTSFLSLGDLKEENRLLKKSLLSGCNEINPSFKTIITESEAMFSVFKYLSVISGTKQIVLIRGETGTGKELVADAIHKASMRSGKFISINAAGLDDTMFSDTLFGHKKGAYSGADNNRTGLIEQAAGGSLFLDEIGDLSANSQIKLLRLFEKGEYYALGSDTLKKASCRIIAATNCDVEKLMEEGLFRKDLYYRLSAHEVFLPPLRERRQDLPMLTDYFVKKISEEMDIIPPEISSGFIRTLYGMELPGNVRELMTIINRCVSGTSGGKITSGTIENLFPGLADIVNESEDFSAAEGEILFPVELPNLKAWSNILVDEALKRTEGNISAAAGLLGISQPALSKRLSKR